jgi:hypothetical protein
VILQWGKKARLCVIQRSWRNSPEVGIGPVIANGDIAMMFHGIPPICYTVNASADAALYESDPLRDITYLIPDSRFEDARKVLLAAGYVDEPLTYVRWTDLGPCYQMRA